MSISLAIGDFSRATHLTVKTLRHYHESGLLEPAEIDERTGYRRYSTEQIPVAQIIRRFRNLDMPLSEIRAVLSAPNVEKRNELIAAHLQRLESELAKTQAAVASLRDLLEQPARSMEFGRRVVTPMNAAAISQVVTVEEALSWFMGALSELHAALAAQQITASGPAGGIFAGAIFTKACGEATMFIPCAEKIRAIGRVVPLLVPGVELATVIHQGAYCGIDIAYGALAEHVTRHELAIEGPLRECYLVGPQDTPDMSKWRTEVGWPIFQTG